MALFDSFHDHYPLDRPRLLIKQIERCGKKPPLPKYQTEDAAVPVWLQSSASASPTAWV